MPGCCDYIRDESQGIFYILDREARRVVAFDAVTLGCREELCFDVPAGITGPLYGISVSPDRVFVGGANCLYVFARVFQEGTDQQLPGEYLERFTYAGSNSAGRGIKWDRGYIHVADQADRKTYLYSEDGTHHPEGSIDFPDVKHAVDIDVDVEADRLFVLGASDQTAYAFRLDGAEADQDHRPLPLPRPVGLSVTGDLTTVVADGEYELWDGLSDGHAIAVAGDSVVCKAVRATGSTVKTVFAGLP